MVGLIFLGVVFVLILFVISLKDNTEIQPDNKSEDLFDEDLKDWDVTLMDGLEDEDDKQDE